MIFITMAKLFSALILGFILNKKGVLDSVTSKKISYIIMQVAFPALIISSVSNAQSGDKVTVLKFLIVGMCVYIALPFVSKIISRILFVKPKERSVYEAMLIFPNFLFMGYPAAAAIFGESCIFYISIFHMLFNVMYYSYGVYLIRKNGKTNEKIKLGQLINNGIIASLIALILFFFNIPLPEVFSEILKFVGNISTPISMIIIGATIGTYDLKDVFYSKRLFIVAGIRLIIFPILIWITMSVLGFSGMMLWVGVITVGMPIASAVSMTSIEYSVNQKLASMSVVVTTLCSVVTIPVMLLIIEKLM